MPPHIICNTSISRLSEVSNLEAIWRDLESRTDAGFMLTWSWIGVWIESQLNDLEPFLLTVKAEEKIVGLAILIVGRSIIARGIREKCLNFHRTGDENRDAISIEYNNILSESGLEEGVTKSVLSFLLNKENLPKPLLNWQGINIGVITDSDLNLFSNPDLLNWYISETHSFGVDLKKIREAKSNYIDQLSKNTRYQIRRSIRIYEDRGFLKIQTAQSADEAISFFRKAGEYHKRRWGSENDSGLFATRDFISFHERLIRSCFDRNEVELIKITVAEQPIGFLYNFIFNGVVYFYQGAFDYEEDNRLKPGLVSHYMCVNKYVEEGKNHYDFMAGDSQYKNSLGKKTKTMYGVFICKNNYKFRTLNCLRTVFNKLKTKSAR